MKRKRESEDHSLQCSDSVGDSDETARFDLDNSDGESNCSSLNFQQYNYTHGNFDGLFQNYKSGFNELSSDSTVRNSPYNCDTNEANSNEVDHKVKSEPSDVADRSNTVKEVNDNKALQNDNLRIFHVLDECEESDTEENLGTEENNYSSESDISDEEIEALLEAKLDENNTQKVAKEKEYSNVRYTERKIVRLEELGHNHFDLLPEGWIEIVHKSGMPVFLHKPTRVCTFSRPYYLGQGSAKRHLAPLSSIPCLQYRKALEEEAKAATAVGSDRPDKSLHNAKIETAEENKASQSLSSFAIQQYCKSLFRFRTEKKLHFMSWADRRRYVKAKKHDKEHQRPTFPDGTKLIKFPIVNPDDGPDAKPRGEWILNPNDKSYICILHEYVQHALKKQPTYEFKPLENPTIPYSATVIISGMKYGYGIGSSKKQAKMAAAKASLEILIPEMREKICNDNAESNQNSNNGDHDEARLSIFDEIKIEDPRVPEFCAKATEPSPYSILLTCLQRNFGNKEMNVECKINPLNRQGNEFCMTVGKHTAKVICKSKKDGKQRASQQILQALHPHISTWGSLLRLYGNKSIKNIKEKKQQEQQVTMLQSKASVNSPNYAILDKLKSEMLKLADNAKKVVPIGVFIPPENCHLPSSGTELSKVDL